MADRSELKFGRSTLQGGGTTDVHIAIEDRDRPDLLLIARNDVEAPQFIGDVPDPFGTIYHSPGIVDQESSGQLIAFDDAPIDRYGLAVSPDQVNAYNGLQLKNLVGTNTAGEAFDWRSGVFEMGGVIETEANSVGERSICFSYTIGSIEPGYRYWGGEEIIYAQSVLPTTAERSTITLISPPIALDFMALRAKYYGQAQALNDPEPMIPIELVTDFVGLRFHQTSGEDILVTGARFWVKRLRGVADGEIS